MNIDTGASLRVALAKFNITSAELAKSFKVHPQQVTRWRSGHDMKISLASNLSHYFGITLGEFIAMGEFNG
jgi:plasmid maintenance system antidote protein VapI